MAEKIIPPKRNEKRFHCPHCKTVAHQIWNDTHTDTPGGSGYVQIHDSRNAFCGHCQKFSIWVEGNMIYPDSTSVLEPNEDLDDEIKEDYLEAASILNKSPRGASALLRLALQKLCKQLGESEESIDKDIAELVRKGLDPTIQQSLDILRVVGNNSVHPGQLDMKDDKETASKLFELINLISESRISQPKKISALYSKLPSKTKEAIEKRDKGE